MRHLNLIAADIAVLALLPLVMLGAVLVMRNPRNPAWLQSENAASGAAFGMVVIEVFVLMFVGKALSAAGLAFVPITAICMLTLIASAIVFWGLLRMTVRLKRADAGGSPFAGRLFGTGGTGPQGGSLQLTNAH